jgi:redox-sensitive bicupin YhaK (pirin superfamily)
MIQVRRASDRGHADHGWLKTWHTFSFATYQDSQHMRYRSLRVMNEDIVAPGQGFGTHPHNDMEIVTYVLSGALEHRDSMGNGEVLRPGEFQRLTAGTGITHSEFNPSKSEPVHLYQIWLYPEKKGLEPSYEQKAFDASLRRNQLQRVASISGEDGSLKIHQDASIYLLNPTPGQTVSIPINAGRGLWIQVLRVELKVDNESLGTGDGASVDGLSAVTLSTSSAAEVMIFDLA